MPWEEHQKAEGPSWELLLVLGELLPSLEGVEAHYRRPRPYGGECVYACFYDETKFSE